MMSTERRKVKARYEATRRTELAAKGRCRDCAAVPPKPGLTRAGKPYVRCQGCIDANAKRVCAWQKARRQAGRCTTCPRKKPRGDRRWNCPRCRRRQAAYDAARKVAA